MNEVSWQKLEGLFILVAGITSIYFTGESWWWLTAILLPDIFMLGYLKSNSIGAQIYNLGHSFVFPVILLLYGLFADKTLFICFASIWTAHIGMDRMLGYGLKKKAGFKHTHLGDL